jgi:S-DNA-T family DNA segregation ATPase FtsK/SpoIIIE
MSQAKGPAKRRQEKGAEPGNSRKFSASRAPEPPAGRARRGTAAAVPAGSDGATAQPLPPPAAPVPYERGDLVTDFWLRFGRYGWDLMGVGLLAFALLTLVGLLNRAAVLGWPNGLLLSMWTEAVGRAFGWGWPVVVVAIAFFGWVCLRQRTERRVRIHLGRVLALEVVAFAFLAFMTVWNGWSLQRVMEGKDGGWVGWGLARILDQVFPDPWGAVVLVSIMVIFGAYGTGLFGWTLRALTRWLDAAHPEVVQDHAAAALVPPEADAEAGETGEPTVLEGSMARQPNLPPLTLLLPEQATRPDERFIQERAVQIEHTLEEFGVPARVVGYRVGPTVTQYAVEPGFVEKPGPDGEVIRQKVRVAQISGLSRDLALALSAERLRIEAPVPGHTYMGIEVPNPSNALVRMRPLLEAEEFRKLSSPLAIALGKDVSGQPVVADLARMPHMLIAGTTGSGKSVCIAAIATCLVMNNHPSELRLAMLDPKMVELVRFNGLPHLLGKVETQLERMLGVLRWAIAEMDRRYRLLEEARSRDIISYNRKVEKRGGVKLPRIVLIVDELADLMMTAPDQTEHNLIRLAQLARATGIHLVVATQRPSTDVVTGLIKANFPARLAFTVASSIDSRVILDGNGAETLLGKGDMLFLNPEAGTPLRAQGILVSDDEIERVLNFWKEQIALDPTYAPEAAPWENLVETPGGDEDSDGLVEQAIRIVRSTQRASTSLIQRRLRIGYPRAARLMDELEELGVVGPSQGGGREREVLLPPEAPGEGDEDSDRNDPDEGVRRTRFDSGSAGPAPTGGGEGSPGSAS